MNEAETRAEVIDVSSVMIAQVGKDTVVAGSNPCLNPAPHEVVFRLLTFGYQ